MSLILDALSRAEREKREATSRAPGILAQETSPAVPASTSRRTWLMGVALATCLCLALFMIFREAVVTDTESEKSSATTPGATLGTGTPERDREATATEQKSTAESAAGLARIRSLEQNAAVAALYARSSAKEHEEPELPAISPASNVAPVASAGDPQQPADARDTRADVTVDNNNEREIDVEQVLRQLRSQATDSALLPHPAPLLEDFTKQFKDGVPTLMYSRHDYRSAGRSSVTINGAGLTPGQRTRGVEVREILPDSVILRFQGNDFRLRALNSWVNL